MSSAGYPLAPDPKVEWQGARRDYDLVKVVLDRAMLDHDPLNYHPLDNARTTAIAPADLLRFIDSCGHRPRIVDLDGVAPE